MPWDPMKGERLAPAWTAAVALLKDGKWHPWDEVVRVMVNSSDLQQRTCTNLLYAALKHGHINRMGKYDRKKKEDGRVLGWGYKELW